MEKTGPKLPLSFQESLKPAVPFLSSAGSPCPSSQSFSYFFSLRNIQHIGNIWKYRFPWKSQQAELGSHLQLMETALGGEGDGREPLLGSSQC